MTDPLNRLLVEHTSATRVNRPGETHHLVPIGGRGGGELLDWVEENGAFKIWKANPAAGPTDDPYRATPRVSGQFLTIGRTHRLVYLGSQLGLFDVGNVLAWVPGEGGIIYEFDRSITSGDPFARVTNNAQWSIPPERTLIYLDHERVLDWDQTTGNIIVWDYDRAAVATDPFPNDLNQTTYPHVLRDHQIVYLGGDMLLIWNQTSGDVDVWRYDRTLLGAVDPFPALAMSDSWAGEIDPARQILYLGADRVLDWGPATGSERIWNFDRPKMPDSLFDVILNTDLDTAAGWVARAQERIVGYQVGLSSGVHDANFALTDGAIRTHFHAHDHPAGIDAALTQIVNTYADILNRFTSGTGSIQQVSKEDAITDLGGIENYTRGYTRQALDTRFPPAYRTPDTIGNLASIDGAGPRLRAAIQIHETTHFVGDNPDFAVEWEPEYDTLTPEQAIRNPATYASFAHHVTEGFFLRFGNQPWI
jgi:hypothetical protein